MENIFLEKIKYYAKNNKTAFTYLENKNIISSITYGEIYNQVEEYYNYFNAINLNNKVCLLYLCAGVDFIPILFGCIKSNIIPIIKTIGATVGKDKLSFKLNEIKNEMPFIDCVITNFEYPNFMEICKDINLNFVNLKNKEKNLSFNSETIKLNADVILLTSGSTKSSKGVMLSIEELEKNVLLCKNFWNINENDKCLNWMPHSHIYGLITGFLMPIYTGGESYIISPKEFSNDFNSYFECLSIYNITHSHTPASNLFLEKGINFIENENFENFSLKNLKTISLGGEAINNTLLKDFNLKLRKYGFNEDAFSPNYGMSEIAGLLCAIKTNEKLHILEVDNYDLKVNNKINISNKFNSCSLVSVGKVNFEEVYILEPDSFNKLSNKEIGEIVISVDSLSNGYVNEEDNYSFVNYNNRTFYRTGDLGILDNEYLIVTGRLKEVLKIKGKNISPYEIENCILLSDKCKYVKNITAFSKKDTVHSEEEIGIFIEINLIKEADFDFINKIIDLLNNKLQIKVKRENIILLRKNKIPRFSNGKISRKNCNEYFYKIKESEQNEEG